MGTSPFLKWAGAKRSHLDRLLPHVPLRYGRYYEPFLGAGSLFFRLEPDKATLGDTIPDLISTYRAVRDGPSAVLKHLTRWPVDRDTYYRVRSMNLHTRFERAAQFIYLNKTCWNGLYRVNSRGEFNVPFGRPKTQTIVTQELLHRCSQVLRNGAVLNVSDFESTVEDCVKGDLVYFDPPYVTGHEHNGFVDYNEQLFSWNDQLRLASTVEKLASRGVDVLLTNSDHEAVKTLYTGFHMSTFERHSTLAASTTYRGIVSEVVISNRAARP